MEQIRGKLEGKTNVVLALVIFGAVIFTGFVATSLNSGLGQMQSAETADASGQLAYSGGSSAHSLTRDASVESDRGGSGGTDTSAERKRIERIDLDFEVPDVNAAVDTAKARAGELGGYTESEDFNRRYGESADVTVRVPKSNVSAFMEDVENRGDWKLQSKNRNIDDVTDRYNELEVELRNKKQELNRLEQLINQTNSTESLIKIQERMGELRSRIQYLSQELEDIDNQVDYTRIRISFEEPEPITAEFNIRESVRDGYRGIFKSLNLMIVGTGYLLPFGLIYLIYRGIKNYRESEEQ